MTTHPTPPDLENKILLAAPSLRDGHFNKSIVLLSEHSPEEGAFGLILNHPSGQKVGDLISESSFLELADLPVYLGGPVARDQLTFAAFWETHSALRFATRISAEEAKAYIAQPGTLVKAFAGYSGWSKNQLEDEIEQQAWSVTTPPADLLTSRHDLSLWKNLLSGLSPYHRILVEAPDEILAN